MIRAENKPVKTVAMRSANQRVRKSGAASGPGLNKYVDKERTNDTTINQLLEPILSPSQLARNSKIL